MSDDDFLAREFGRSLTDQIAPAESPFYDELLQAYANPKAAKKDRSLAFGVTPDGVIAMALFEVGKVVLEGIWSAAKPMLTGIVQDSTAELRAQLSDKIKDWIKSHFEASVPVEIPQADMQKILAAVKQTAAQQGLDDAQVGQVAQTISKALGAST